MKRLFLIFIIAVLQVVSHAAGPYATNQLSLPALFPVERVAEVLLPRESWHPFPRFEDRQGWEALPQAVSRRLLKLGEEDLAKPLPVLPATLYLEYARNGNRSHYEAVYFERRGMLQNLVLAECVEGKGRFLNAAADTLWSICEESSWCLPAHVGVQRAKVGLPDVTEPIVDLFAGETGVTVAWSVYLIGRQLDTVSPQLRRRAELELARRILNPVLDRNFGWMALDVTSPDRCPNNWTPWIAASVLTTALLEEADAARRVQIVHKMLRSLDGFLKFYPADGSCDEGPGYWSRAGGSLLDCLEVLQSASAGRIDVFSEPLVQEIGRFIERAYIAGDYFVPIGDCAARMEPEHSLIFRYGKRINDPQLQAFGAHGATVESMLGGNFLGRQIYAVFEVADVLANARVPLPLQRDIWLGSEDMQLLAARSRAGTVDGLYLAAWGGHNAQSHNHNDVGNFLVFADGQPVFVDPGAPTYTAQTFSSRRYDIWAFQSAFHNLPTINGVMQSAGRQFAASDVVCTTNDALAELIMDLASAYPAAAKVKTWRRIVRLHRGQDVEITDAFKLTESVGQTTLNLITPLAAETKGTGEILLSGSGKGGERRVTVRLLFDGEKLTPAIEPIALTDGRLARSWGPQLNRLILRGKPGVLADAWTLRVQQR